MLDCHLVQYLSLSNSLGPSFLTHSLQIHCIRLIGPKFHIIWTWAPNCDPTSWLLDIYLGLTKFLTEGFEAFLKNFDI